MRERWSFNVDNTIYSHSVIMYNVTAPYAPSPMPPESLVIDTRSNFWSLGFEFHGQRRSSCKQQFPRLGSCDSTKRLAVAPTNAGGRIML